MGLYHEIEDKVLAAIDESLGGQWWNNLCEDAQERIHDNLFQVLETAQPQEPEERAENSTLAPCNTGSTCAAQIAAEMELAAFAARNSGDVRLAELLEGWQRRLRTA